MKKLLITVAVLLLLYPVAAWLMGFAIEWRLDRFTDQGLVVLPQIHVIQKTAHGVLTSDVDSVYEVASAAKITRHYHRGWFSSVDEATVEMSGSMLAALSAVSPAVASLSGSSATHTPFSFSLRTVIHHGPFCGFTCFALAEAETHVGFTGPLQAALTRVFGKEEPITIRGRLGFFGGGSGTTSSPAFAQAQIGRDARVSWGGIDSTMHYGARWDWYDLIAAAPSMRLDGPKGALQMDSMNVDARGKRLLRTLYEGDSRIAVKRLTVTGADKAQQIDANDLLFVNQNHAQAGFMNLSYQVGAGSIVTQPLTLSSAHVDLTYKHLGVESLESLIVAIREAGQQNASVAPAARAQTMMAALKQPFQALLLEQPEMDIDRVSFANAQGQAVLTGVIRLIGVGAGDFDVPARLMGKLDVNLDFTIDEKFLASLPGAAANALTQLQPMIDQGYITRANGALRTQILYRAGQTTFNGKLFNAAAVRPAVAPPPGAPSPH
jgi:uncharacterized protein YdgA (DUF945 family)